MSCISDTLTKMYDRETYGEIQTYGEKSILSPAVNSIRFDKGQVLSSEIGGLRKREMTDLF